MTYQQWQENHSKPVALSLSILDNLGVLERVEGCTDRRKIKLLPFSVRVKGEHIIYGRIVSFWYITTRKALHKLADDLLMQVAEQAVPPWPLAGCTTHDNHARKSWILGYKAALQTGNGKSWTMPPYPEVLQGCWMQGYDAASKSLALREETAEEE